MSKQNHRAARKPRPHQDKATAPPPRDSWGVAHDAWGLPVIGPLRAARLAQIGLPDPHDDPAAWDGVAPVKPVDPATLIGGDAATADADLEADLDDAPTDELLPDAADVIPQIFAPELSNG